MKGLHVEVLPSKRAATQLASLAHCARHVERAVDNSDGLSAWRLRMSSRTEPSREMSYSSRNVTLSNVTIVGRAALDLVVVRACETVSVWIVVRVAVTVDVIAVATCSTIVSTT